MISMIAAMDKNHTIGNKGKLPWTLPEDMEHFKNITIGKTVVMGRKTFDSIGKPLEGRKNIILTRNKDFKADCIILHSIEEVLEYKDFIVIGGEEVYKQFLPLASKLYITLIPGELKGDRHFPKIEGFKETSKTRNKIQFIVYERT
jgi:dihydrofolate reductase